MNTNENICDFVSMAEFLKAERIAESYKQELNQRELCREHCQEFIDFLKDCKFSKDTICDVLLENLSQVAVLE